MLAGLAEFERDLIPARNGEGRGVKLGRKFKLTQHQQKEARARRDRGETLVDIARSYNVSVELIVASRKTRNRPTSICSAIRQPRGLLRWSRFR